MKIHKVKHYQLLLVVILIWAAGTRLWRLSNPSIYIFDEVYHAVTAKLIAHNDPKAFEWWNPPVEPNTAVDWLHPPYAKYTQALSMLVFGENSYGWRFSAAVFGVLVILATASLARQWWRDERVALLAATLASLDGLLLTQSRIAMNDIHVTFFILVTLWLYWQVRPNLLKFGQTHWKPTFAALAVTGLSAGLSLGSKWSGLFVLAWLWLVTGFEHLQVMWQWDAKHNWPKKWLPKTLRFGGMMLICWLVLPLLVYGAGYWQMFTQGKTLRCSGDTPNNTQCYCSQTNSWWVNLGMKLPGASEEWWENLEARGGCARLISHFSELHHQIWWYQTHLEATHPYQSRPWQWFLNLRPVWYHVEYTENGQIANIYALGNTLLFWSGAVSVVASLVYLAITLKKRKWTDTHTRLLWLLAAYFIVWLPWQLSPRIMFFYHYTPAVPLLCIILAWWLVQGWSQTLFKKEWLAQTFVACIVGLILANFIIWYPNWTGLKVPTEFANKIYFALPSWK